MHILLGHENCQKRYYILVGQVALFILLLALYQDTNEKLSTNQGKLVTAALLIAHDYLVNSS